MESNKEKLKVLAHKGEANQSSKAKKTYRPPNFAILGADQAKVELKFKGLPEDPAVQKLLRLADRKR